jgi:hypothetical protein
MLLKESLLPIFPSGCTESSFPVTDMVVVTSDRREILPLSSRPIQIASFYGAGEHKCRSTVSPPAASGLVAHALQAQVVPPQKRERLPVLVRQAPESCCVQALI